AQGNPNNPIVVENLKAGDPSWSAGASEPSLQGFATNISINTGQTVDFKIKATAPTTSYTIDIYRLGYYGNALRGEGARKIAHLPARGAFAARAQPACLTEPSTALVDCGTWNVSASWLAKENGANVISGIYLAKLTSLQTNGSNFIVFIVRDDARHADVIVQTSDTTWQAYNRYGDQFGKASLYCADQYSATGAAPFGGPLSNAGTAYGCASRAAKVSYNRPFDTDEHDPQSFLFNAEYPMLRWLEANGYDVKYISGVDTDRYESALPAA